MLKRTLHILLTIIIALTGTQAFAAVDQVYIESAQVEPQAAPALSFFGNSLTIPAYSDYTFNGEEGVLYLHGSKSPFSVVITCDRLDEATQAALRDYYNEKNVSSSWLFDKLLEYKKSYFNALRDYYKKEFLYANDRLNNESNLVVLGSYSEPIYGKKSETLLYNILREGSDGPSEETRINITIPVKTDLAIYSITFILDKGGLTKETTDEMTSLISSIEIKDLPKQSSKLKVFTDQTSLNRANMGIYPVPGTEKASFFSIENQRAGYRLTLPSSVIPYRQNSIVGALDYKSWKTGLHQFFSLTVELAYGNLYIIDEKIKFIKDFNTDKIGNVTESLTQVNDNYFYQINYELTDSGFKTYLQDYFLVKDDKLYSFHFSSSDIITEELKTANFNAVASLELIPGVRTQNSDELLRKYTDIKDGYSLSYPSGWQRVQSTPRDKEFDTFQLVNSSLSGSVDILVSEGQFFFEPDINKTVNLLSGTMDAEAHNYLSRYNAPYSNKKSKLLTFSLQKSDGVQYLNKLVNYIDSNGRSKLCFSTDIIKGKSVYSLYVTVNEYATEDGRLINDRIYDTLTAIAASFRMEKRNPENPMNVLSYLAYSPLK